jgi:hypothetical protein
MKTVRIVGIQAKNRTEYLSVKCEGLGRKEVVVTYVNVLNRHSAGMTSKKRADMLPGKHSDRKAPGPE